MLALFVPSILYDYPLLEGLPPNLPFCRDAADLGGLVDLPPRLPKAWAAAESVVYLMAPESLRTGLFIFAAPENCINPSD